VEEVFYLYKNMNKTVFQFYSCFCNFTDYTTAESAQGPGERIRPIFFCF